MPNAIKYSTIGDTLSLKKGNIFFGVGDVGKGPSSATTYYNGVTPSGGGYTIYSYNASQTSNLSFHTAVSDAALITYTNGVSGQNFTTAIQCLNWYATQSNYACVNKDYEGIVTNGLVMNVDAGFIPSYPTNGTTWYDLSYNGNNISLTNGPIYDGGDGGSFIFDGSDDYGRNDIPNLPTGNVTTTICVWAYVLNTNSEWQGFAGWGNTTTGQSILLDMNNGRLALSTWGSLSSQDLISSYTVPNNSWRYLVGSINDKNMKLYADGVKVLDSSITSTPNVQSTNLRIATTDYPGRLLNTKISCVQVYNKELSQSEIIQNFNAGLTRFNTPNTVKDGLTLSLDPAIFMSYPTSGTIWRDLSGYGNTATLVNGPTFNSTSRAIVFDGTDDFASVGNSKFNIVNQFTIEVVCKSTGSQVNGMFNFKGPNYDRGIMTHWPWVDGNGYFDIYNTAGGFHRWYGNISSFVNTVNMFHFILNSDGSMVVKRNGLTVTPTSSNTFSGVVNLGETNSIGAFHSDGNSAWPGVIYDFKIYNKPLTQSEILQNYYGAPIITDGLVMSLDAGNPVSYEGSGTTWKDLTSNGNNNTLFNGPTFSNINGGVISFDGTDDYGLGTIPSSTFTGAHSIGCWFYRRTVTQWAGLFSNNVNTSSCSLLTFIDSTNKIGINQAGVSATDISIDLGSGHLNKWIYCVLVVSGVSNGSPVNVYAYMDGSLLTSSGNLYWNISTSSSYYVARHWASGSQILDGFIPQVSVYNRALTLQEVSQNYNATKARFGL